jgi:hypothetical protein
MIWLVVIDMGRVVRCPFCDTDFRIREDVSDLEAAAWLDSTHAPMHADVLERLAYQPMPPGPDCARCQRYAAGKVAPTDPIHRKCFEPFCGCACSQTPAKETR